MYRKDYILTMIEELAQFLGRLIFLKETSRFEAALAEIDEVSGRLFERSIRQLDAMTPEEILTLSRGWEDVRRSFALGSILKELGDIASLKGDEARAGDLYGKGLGVLLDIYGTGQEALPLETVDKIETLLQLADGGTIPPIVARLLFLYQERGGFYADAEDLLFDLLQHDEPGMLDEGIAFYERLLTKDDTDLRDGNLPREEVEEGLSELRRKKA